MDMRDNGMDMRDISMDMADISMDMADISMDMADKKYGYGRHFFRKNVPIPSIINHLHPPTKPYIPSYNLYYNLLKPRPQKIKPEPKQFFVND